MTDALTQMRSGLMHRAAQMKNRVSRAIRQIHLDTNQDWKETTFLAGSGRGGTTWVAEIINYDNSYRFIFEPFYAKKVPLVGRFRNRQYIRPGDDNPAFVDPATTVMSGSFRNAWSDYYNRRIVSRRRLIKDIRANLFLRWIFRRFPGVPIVLLMRHPCAVITSRMSLSWDSDLHDFLDQPELMADHLEPYRNRIESTTDGFERHMLRWCIENSVPLRQFARGEIHLAFYEEFCERPRVAVENLFSFLKKPVGERVFAQLDKPSSQTRRQKSAIMFGERPADSWRKHISRDQMNRALEILALFGLDAIYAEGSMPNVAAANALLGRR